MSNEYNLGYFEGLRNAMIHYMQMPDKEQWFQWLNDELTDANQIYIDTIEPEEDSCICKEDENNLNCEWCY